MGSPPCRELHAAYCMLRTACCALCAVCCMLRVACCELASRAPLASGEAGRALTHVVGHLGADAESRERDDAEELRTNTPVASGRQRPRRRAAAAAPGRARTARAGCLWIEARERDSGRAAARREAPAAACGCCAVLKPRHTLPRPPTRAHPTPAPTPLLPPALTILVNAAFGRRATCHRFVTCSSGSLLVAG